MRERAISTGLVEVQEALEVRLRDRHELPKEPRLPRAHVVRRELLDHSRMPQGVPVTQQARVRPEPVPVVWTSGETSSRDYRAVENGNAMP